MKDKIIAKDKWHLSILVKNEINRKGNECDLNHFDISNVTDLSELFSKFKYNMLFLCPAPKSYWITYADENDRKNAIDKYVLNQDLSCTLENNNSQVRKIKL